MYRLGNILQTALTDILELNLNNLPDLVVDRLRDENSSRLRQLFQPNSNVDVTAVKIVLFDDHIAQIDADAEAHPFGFGDRGVALRNLVLDLDGAANGLDNAAGLATTPSPARCRRCDPYARRSSSSTTTRYMRRVAVEASSSSSVRRLYPSHRNENCSEPTFCPAVWHGQGCKNPRIAADRKRRYRVWADDRPPDRKSAPRSRAPVSSQCVGALPHRR